MSAAAAPAAPAVPSGDCAVRGGARRHTSCGNRRLPSSSAARSQVDRAQGHARLRRARSTSRFLRSEGDSITMPTSEEGAWSMSGSYDVAIVGGCGHVGLPLGPRLREPRASTSRSTTSTSSRSPPVNGGDACRSTSPARPRCSPRSSASGHAPGLRRPAGDRRRRARGVVIGTPIDEHLNPDLNAVPGADRRHRAAPARRPAARAAQHRVPGRHRAGRATRRRPRPRRRRRVLPRAHRRGQGDGRAVRAPADRRVALAARARAGEQAVRQPRRTRSS